MTVYLIDAAMDAELAYLSSNITERYICAGDPTDRTGAVSAALCTQTGLSGTDFTGPAAGDVSGRKLTKKAETGNTIDVTGTAATVCYTSSSDLIWKVDISNTQLITSGGTANTSAHTHEIADAT